MSEVPLICDPVPSADLAVGVLIVDRQLTEQETATLRARWELAKNNGMMLLPECCSFVSIFSEKQWPDAEFCAA